LRLVFVGNSGIVVHMIKGMADVVLVLGKTARTLCLVEEFPAIGLTCPQSFPLETGVYATISLPVILKYGNEEHPLGLGGLNDIVEFHKFGFVIDPFGCLKAVPGFMAEHP